MRRCFRRFITVLLLIVTISIALLIVFRVKYNDSIVQLAQTQITNSTSDLINDAIDVQIEVGNIQYERIVYFEKDLDGRITALKTNMSEVNRLKTDILGIINDEILTMDTSTLGINIGSLVLPEFISGRGPEIPIEILSIRNSDGYFESSFSEAGINQTLHQLTMHVVVDVSILVLGKTETFTVSSQVVVAETIIVGNVPDTYLQTGGIYGSITENKRTIPDPNGSKS